jgi:hypothetical protein
MALALVVAVAAAGCASRAHRSATAGASIAAPATPTATRTHVFHPAAAAGAAAATGTCWTTSVAMPKPGAYRCLVRNAILDPCFAARLADRLVACYADPWSKPTTVRLTQPLPTVRPLSTARPWALLLADGRRCVAVTGTVQIVGNVALTYSCGTGAAGLTGTSGGLRLAFYRSAPQADLDQVAVTDVWV